MAGISNFFGYILNFIYNIVGNYGFAIILFTLLLKAVMLPFTYKQQVTMKKSAKIQEKVKIIQFKYKNDIEKLNRETMDLYKREKMNPLSGCISGILQIVILLSLFYLVRSPLTHMKKIDTDVLNKFLEQVEADESQANRSAYPEINLIRYIREHDANDNSWINEDLRNLMAEKSVHLEDFDINMEFLGLDLSLVPSTAMNNWEVYVIPVLYVISSFISMKISTNLTKASKKQLTLKTGNDDETSVEGEKTEFDTVETMNKSFTWLMPIMSVSISLIAPLGLALYWLTNNILITAERVIITKMLDKKEEQENA